MWVSSIDKYISQTSNATHMYHLLDVCEVHGSFSLSLAPLKIFPVGVSTSGGQDLYLAFILLLVWNKRIDKLLQNIRYINPCVLNAPFLYPLKTSENLKVFWYFRGVEKGCIGNEWVKVSWKIIYIAFCKINAAGKNFNKVKNCSWDKISSLRVLNSWKFDFLSSCWAKIAALTLNAVFCK